MLKKSIFGIVLVSVALAKLPSAGASEVKCIGDGRKLSGRVPNIQRFTDCAGYRFRVMLSNLQYAGEVNTTLLEQSRDGVLTVWFSLKDVRVTIGHISLSGRPGTADCGPTAIDIANRRELWVAFDFERQTQEDGIRLTLKNTRVGLPRDNWMVGTPAWVKTSGFGMSRGKVVSGVRDGLARSQPTVEQQITQMAYSVLTEFAAVPEGVTADQVAIETALTQKLIAEGHLTRDGRIVPDGPTLASTEKD